MGISRYIFFSIYNADKHPEVPLMAIKSATEDFLRSSGVPATILRLCGFHQAVIGNYAVPILEDRQVWGTNDDSKTAYMDTQVGGRVCGAAAGPPGVCAGRSRRLGASGLVVVAAAGQLQNPVSLLSLLPPPHPLTPLRHVVYCPPAGHCPHDAGGPAQRCGCGQDAHPGRPHCVHHQAGAWLSLALRVHCFWPQQHSRKHWTVMCGWCGGTNSSANSPTGSTHV